MAPAAKAATVPVHVTLAVPDPAGPNNGITFGVAGSAPGQVMAVANESVTVTFAKNDVPVLVTTNVTVTGEPATTDTPGAVFASSPFSDFTMETPADAGANACAGSNAVGASRGSPSAPTAGTTPSDNVGFPVTKPTSLCFSPGSNARMVAVHSIESPGAKSDCGQVIPEAAGSVTVTFARYDDPVLVTTNVTDNGAPAATDTPGAVFASSPLIDFMMLTPEVAGANAYASSVSVGGGNGRPSAPNAGVDPSANTGVPDTDPVFTCVAPGARAATVPVHVTLAVSEPAGPNNGITLAVSAAAPGQVMPVANESVTVTFARCAVPVLVTTNVTVTGEPATTDTPGAVFASSPLSDFTMLTPEVAGANAYASSVSDGGGNGRPSAPNAGVDPSANTGVPDTLPVST